MKIMKSILFVIVLVLCIASCKDWGYFSIWVKNASTDTIAVTCGIQQIGKKQWKISSEFPVVPFYEVIAPNTRESLDFFDARYREIEQSPQDSFSIFIIHPDTLRLHNWEEIGKKRMFIRKYTKPLKEFDAEATKGCYFVYTGKDD